MTKKHKPLGTIDKIYRKSLSDYPTPEKFYKSLGLPEYANACAARMCYALQESGVLVIPEVKGQTRRGADGRNYFMFAKDLRNYFVKKWGAPRVFDHLVNPKVRILNGVVSQSCFGNGVTGHAEYFYNGHDGHWNSNKDGALRYYYDNAITELWKCGFK